MSRLFGTLGATALLILGGGDVHAANMPGEGSCGPRTHIEDWMSMAGAVTPGYSIVDVRHPRTGEVVGQVEMSFWANAEGQTAVVLIQLATDPQHGEIAFGCVMHQGDGMQSAPIFLPRKGA